LESPKGIKGKDNECVLLKKSLYGLVQSARQLFKKLIQVLTLIGFKQSNAESCFLILNGKFGKVVIAIHVDDCYTIGSEEALQEVIQLIEQNGLKIKV
jgi:Reverse transcriptase (RNA-dependent DNA polymerase)